MKLKEVPKSERPREKLIKYGKENLSDSELLALIIKTGTKDKSAIELSLELLKEIENLKNLKDATYESLTKIKGIGSAKAVELLGITELSKRIYYQKTNEKKEKYQTPEEIYNKNKYLFDNINQEYFYCLYLNNKKELIERKLLFIGTLNKSLVHPREIFKEAYKLSASSIVCLHNHPSGDLTPSKNDIELTDSLVKIGELNKIPIIDHLIITEKGYFSFYENMRK